MAHPALVQALLRPGAYPVEARPSRVELVETHVSYLFLTGSYVYKVKKPVDYGFLDFTTLERRRHFCHQEATAEPPPLAGGLPGRGGGPPRRQLLRHRGAGRDGGVRGADAPPPSLRTPCRSCCAGEC